MKLDRKAIGIRIKSIRQSRGMTLEEFGRLFEASKGNVLTWEKGISAPSNARLKKIADLGNITVEELLYGNKQTNLLNFFNQKWQEAEHDDFKNILGKVKQLTPNEETKKQVYNAYMTFASASDIFDPINLLKHFERAVKNVYHELNGEGLLSQIREEIIFLLTTHLKWSESIKGYDVDKYNQIVELTIPYLSALNGIAETDKTDTNEILFNMWRRNIEANNQLEVDEAQCTDTDRTYNRTDNKELDTVDIEEALDILDSDFN